MTEHQGFEIRMEQVDDYEFRVRFDGEQGSELLMDEPEPVGTGKGPNASRVLAAAIGNCLTASLLFCARKSRVELAGLQTVVRGRLGRNEQGRLRLLVIDVVIEVPGDAGDGATRMERCLSIFEDYCVVTASVRRGVPVRVEVLDGAGKRLFSGGEEPAGP